MALLIAGPAGTAFAADLNYSDGNEHTYTGMYDRATVSNGSTLTNSGWFGRTDYATDTVAVTVTGGSTFINAGSVSARYLSSSSFYVDGSAIVAEGGSTVRLESGSSVVGAVIGNDTSNLCSLELDGEGGGEEVWLRDDWDTVTKTSAGTWEINPQDTDFNVENLKVDGGTLALWHFIPSSMMQRVEINNGTQLLLDGGSAITADSLALAQGGTLEIISGRLNIYGAAAVDGTILLGQGRFAVMNGLTVTHSGSIDVGDGTLVVYGDLTVQSGGMLTVAAYGQAAPDVMVTGTADIADLRVSPSAEYVGDSTLIYASDVSVGSVSSTNPNFVVSTGVSGSELVATTAFKPQSDGPSLATASLMNSVGSFAAVARARTLSVMHTGFGVNLASADDVSKPILVADNSSSLAGLLRSREEAPRWGVYLQPVYSHSSRDAQGMVAGYDADMVGLEAGVDHRFGPDWLAGAYAGWGANYIDFNSSSDFSDDDNEHQFLYTFGVYVGHKRGDWTFSDILSTTYTRHKSKRNAGLSETAKADYDSWMTMNQFQAVYDWTPDEYWRVSPRGGLNVIYLHQDAFSETGATNAVRYDDLDKYIAEAELGLRVSRRFQCGDTTVEPYAGMGVIHSLGDGDITVRQYLPTTSARITTRNDDNRFAPELGVTFRRGAMDVSFGYSGQYGEHAQSGNVFGMVRWMF